METNGWGQERVVAGAREWGVCVALFVGDLVLTSATALSASEMLQRACEGGAGVAGAAALFEDVRIVADDFGVDRFVIAVRRGGTGNE